MGCHSCLRFTLTTFTFFWLSFGFHSASIRLPFGSLRLPFILGASMQRTLHADCNKQHRTINNTHEESWCPAADGRWNPLECGPSGWLSSFPRSRAQRSCAFLRLTPLRFSTPSNHGVGASVIKNWHPFVFGPEFAYTHTFSLFKPLPIFLHR